MEFTIVLAVELIKVVQFEYSNLFNPKTIRYGHKFFCLNFEPEHNIFYIFIIRLDFNLNLILSELSTLKKKLVLDINFLSDLSDLNSIRTQILTSSNFGALFYF